MWKSLLEYFPLQYNADSMDVNFHKVMVPKLSSHAPPCSSKVSWTARCLDRTELWEYTQFIQSPDNLQVVQCSRASVMGRRCQNMLSSKTPVDMVTCVTCRGATDWLLQTSTPLVTYRTHLAMTVIIFENQKLLLQKSQKQLSCAVMKE